MPAKLSATTRMPQGVTNAAPRQTMANYGAPDPVWSAYIDLDYIQNGDITAMTATGTATMALVAGFGGLATMTTGAVGGTIGAQSTNQAVFSMPSTALNTPTRLFFKWAGSIDSLLGTIQVGFVSSVASSPQGVYIQSTVTTGALSLIIKNGSGTTTVPFPAALALVAGTQVELGIEIDPTGNVFAFYNPTTGESPSNTNGTIGNGAVTAAYVQLNGALTGIFLPTGALFASMGATPSTSVARVMTVDYFVAAQHRFAI